MGLGAQGQEIRTEHSPVGHDTRVVTLLVLINLHVTHHNKGRVSAVGSDYTTAGDRLGEMGVNGRAADRLQALQLPRRGHIKSLKGEGGGANTALRLNEMSQVLTESETIMMMMHTDKPMEACTQALTHTHARVHAE